jgi:hypothetical protein
MALSCNKLSAMSAVWWIPLAIGVVAPGLLGAAGRPLARRLVALDESTAALRALRPAVAEIRRQAERTRRALDFKDLQ